MTVPAKARREACIMRRGEGRSIRVIDNDVTIKISSRHTGGAFTVFEGQIMPLQGPPLHLHRDQDESWYVVDGEFKFEVDGQEIYASTGDTVFAPRGSWHTFQNIGAEPGVIVTTVIPGGLDIFFEELEAAAPRGTAPDPSKMLPIFEKHGLELLGPPLAARSASARACDSEMESTPAKAGIHWSPGSTVTIPSPSESKRSGTTYETDADSS
jgi:quercetin dioxygenase-like cupin family protein